MDLYETVLKISAVVTFACVCGFAIDQGSESGITASVAMLTIAFGLTPTVDYLKKLKIEKKKEDEKN